MPSIHRINTRTIALPDFFRTFLPKQTTVRTSPPPQTNSSPHCHCECAPPTRGICNTTTQSKNIVPKSIAASRSILSRCDCQSGRHKRDAGKVSPEQMRRNPRRHQRRHKPRIHKMLHCKDHQAKSQSENRPASVPGDERRSTTGRLSRKLAANTHAAANHRKQSQTARSTAPDHEDASPVSAHSEQRHNNRIADPRNSATHPPSCQTAMLTPAIRNPAQPSHATIHFHDSTEAPVQVPSAKREDHKLDPKKHHRNRKKYSARCEQSIHTLPLHRKGSCTVS